MQRQACPHRLSVRGLGWAAGGGGLFAFNSVHFCIIDVCVYVHVKLLMCVYFFLKTQLLHIN